MNPIRSLLSRDRVARRCLYFVIFTVLFARALLSGAVMVDPDAPAGSFGLVICSGQGPMFPGMHMPTPASAEAMRMPMSMGIGNEMSMKGRLDNRQNIRPPAPMPAMAMMPVRPDHGKRASTAQIAPISPAATPEHAHTSDPIIVTHVDDMRDSHDGSAGLCPFSAVLLTAIAALFVFALFLVSVTLERFRPLAECRRLVLPTAHSRPLSRAPPAFV